MNDAHPHKCCLCCCCKSLSEYLCALQVFLFLFIIIQSCLGFSERRQLVFKVGVVFLDFFPFGEGGIDVIHDLLARVKQIVSIHTHSTSLSISLP